MKLRNKKTGEVADFKIIADYDDCTSGWRLEKQDGSVLFYDYIDEIKEEWEDYKPKEPLIKDEKVRKAVRAWAEANDITKVNVASSGYELWGGIDDWCIHFGGNPFKNIKPLKYTIDELCGEEEE